MDPFRPEVIDTFLRCAENHLAEQHRRAEIVAILRAAFPELATDNDNAALDATAIRAGEQSDTDAEIKRLAKLSVVDYERKRKDAAERLSVRTTILDRLVTAERDKAGDGKQGRALKLPEPEPWHEPVSGAELLNELSATIRRYVVMTDYMAETAALWVLHTYLLDCFTISPRLAITSPEKRCGNTTMLDVLFRLAWRPLETANATGSAIYRAVEMSRPTLLIDEADTFFDKKDELRGILNSGHRLGGSVIRSVGDDFEPRTFSTYSACAIARIGKLPATLADRSVHIELHRRLKTETIERFRLDRTDHLDHLARKARRWAADNADKIRAADPKMPGQMFNRVADNWRPLLAIADAADEDWPARGRRTAQSGGVATSDDDQSITVLLLADIRDIFTVQNEDRLPSERLVEALVKIEDRLWVEWGKKRKPLTKTASLDS